MNCCSHREPFPCAGMHFTAVLRSQPAAHHLLPTEGAVLAYFSLLWLQLAPSMHQGPALLKTMQVGQILIQIAVLVGFTPAASIAQFSNFNSFQLFH